MDIEKNNANISYDEGVLPFNKTAAEQFMNQSAHTYRSSLDSKSWSHPKLANTNTDIGKPKAVSSSGDMRSSLYKPSNVKPSASVGSSNFLR